MSASAEAVAPRSASLTREVVGVFDGAAQLQIAVDHLQESGFNRHDLSTAGDIRKVDEALHHAYVDVREIEDSAEIPRRIFVSKVSLGDAEGILIGVCVYLPATLAAGIAASKGHDIATVVWAVGIAGALGGVIGWLLARWLDRRYARGFQEHLNRGGLVLWVVVHDGEQEARARDILTLSGARDVHVHELDRAPKPIPGWRGVSYEMSFMKRMRL
jgi:hypothetical protein